MAKIEYEKEEKNDIKLRKNQENERKKSEDIKNGKG